MRLPEPYTFFIDRCLGTGDVGVALQAAGLDVRLHDAVYAQDTPDEDWLRDVGARGWIVLTKDGRIRRNQAQITALMHARVAAFVLTSAGLSGAEQATAFVKAAKRMHGLLQAHQVPFIATVTRDGGVETFMSHRWRQDRDGRWHAPTGGRPG